jgi:hypothetical protein
MDSFFRSLLEKVVQRGLMGVALVDRDGRTVGLAGAISEEEAMPIAALVMYREKSPDLAARLLEGEVVTRDLEDRVAAVAVAKRQLFVVATLTAATETQLALVRELRENVAARLAVYSVSAPPWSGGRGGSGSGPAELPLIELGITVPRAKA